MRPFLGRGVVLAAGIAVVVGALVGDAQGVEALTPAVTLGPVTGRFFANPSNDGAFRATPAQAVEFTQTFPVINFNPPAGRVRCSNDVNVDVNTRPFTDVIPLPGGSCATQVAAGNGKRAGAVDTSLFNFDAVFTSTLTVSAAGDVRFDFFSDDGWIMGMAAGPGGAPTYVSGSRVNAPGTTPFEGYPVLGALNEITAPVGTELVVHFPAGGAYPIELDYAEGVGGQLSFTVQANGTSIPAQAPGPPVLGRSVNVVAVSGRVLVRLRGTSSFVPLSTLDQIPVGSEIDATNGRVRLSSVTPGGKVQTSDFYGGRFIVTQTRSGLTILRLSAPLACGRRSLGTADAKRRRERHLWGDGKGRFRTQGKFASATIRGTIWLTQDRCRSTLVRVRRGRVDVFDLVLRRHFLVGPGQSHVARR